MKESQVREYLGKGWLRAIITFEVVGRPRAHVEKSLSAYVENIKKDNRLIVLKDDREEALEHEDGLFSAFSELDVLAKNLEVLTWLSVNFSPASIEITEPSEIRIPTRDLTNWFNDLLASVHEIGTNVRNVNAYNDHLRVAMNQLVKNAVLLSLKGGSRTTKEIEAITGIIAEQLVPFLDAMAQKADIVKDGEMYSIPDPARKAALLKSIAAAPKSAAPMNSIAPAKPVTPVKPSVSAKSVAQKAKRKN